MNQPLIFVPLVLATMLLGSSCSYQYRVTNPGATPEEVSETLDRIQNSQFSGLSFDSGLVTDLREDPTGTTYFTRSGTNGLYPENVFSIADVGPFVDGNPTLRNAFELGLQEASIAFVDGISSESVYGGERQFVLMIELILRGQENEPVHFVSVSDVGAYVFTDESFEVRFTGKGGESIVLKTYSLDNDRREKFDSNIKFDVFIEDGNGQRPQIGFFSALAGFGS